MDSRADHIREYQVTRRHRIFPVGSSTFWGVCQWGLCLGICLLSGKFAYGTPATSRPIVPFILLMCAMFVVYLLALRSALRERSDGTLVRSVLMLGVAMRLVLVFSTPIQELDYYRYIWDGKQILSGVSPYSYSPQQVLTYTGEGSEEASEFKRLIELKNDELAYAVIASRVHFGDLPTIYPPVSLAVFTAAVATAPGSSSVETIVVIMKSWIVLFDIAIVGILFLILKHCKCHIGWLISYAWCPLVLKEFANSGHLDAIAVTIMMASILFLMKFLFPLESDSQFDRKRWLIASGVFLGLGIGAKLFPVVLFPIIVVSVLKRRGFYLATQVASIGLVVGGLSCLPMMIGGGTQFRNALPTNKAGELTSQQVAPLTPSDPPLPIDTDVTLNSLQVKNDRRSKSVEEQDSSIEASSTDRHQGMDSHPAQHSLKVFLTQWKMNDLFFMFIETNLTPDDLSQTPVWSTVIPATWRKRFVSFVAEFSGIPYRSIPFVLTRFLLTGVFATLALIWAWRGASAARASDWLEYVFSTLAWFWLLSPTLNPWYWSWALPLIAFSRQRSWLLVSGCLSVYYLRFWFAATWPVETVLTTPYSGDAFFHYVVVWGEHLPWLALLVCESSLSRKNMKAMCATSQTENADDSILSADRSM